jgi:Flp pilus assembly protein TadB
MTQRNSPTTRNHSNAGTAIALAGLIFMSVAILGLMALVLPQLLGVLLVILIFAVPAAFHYLIWGWWLSQARNAELDEEKLEE